MLVTQEGELSKEIEADYKVWSPLLSSLAFLLSCFLSFHLVRSMGRDQDFASVQECGAGQTSKGKGNPAIDCRKPPCTVPVPGQSQGLRRRKKDELGKNAGGQNAGENHIPSSCASEASIE
jgi:hypothetical protein